MLVEATHVHLLCVVDNPDDIAQFMKCFKTETAHAFNRILGRTKRTIWCEGSDDPVVLTPLRTLIAIAYLYANPSKDCLESSIDKYPGFSTWKMFTAGEMSKEWKRIRRPQYRALTRENNNLKGYTKEAERLVSDSKETVPFKIEPNAWLDAFGITQKEEQDRMNARLIARVRYLEQRAALIRSRHGHRVVGKEQLLRQVLSVSYRPQRYGKRMWCLSEKRSVRKKFITFLKDLMAKARSVRERWYQGDFSVPYPPGLFPPSMPKLANAFGRW